jgi:transcriptional regulator with XRE-family HTH domain
LSRNFIALASCFQVIYNKQRKRKEEWVQIPRLRQWREARALTQEELAEKAGISARSVAGYEAGAGARPGTVRRLALALHIETGELSGLPPKVRAPLSPEEVEERERRLTEEERLDALSLEELNEIYRSLPLEERRRAIAHALARKARGWEEEELSVRQRQRREAAQRASEEATEAG